MHSVLLIDEVFQVLLEHCADWPVTDYRSILCQLARSCRAWKDPATDRLWKRLNGAGPLLRLLRDGSDATSEPPLEGTIHLPEEFVYYASKVKHITYTSAPFVIQTSKMPLLPNLSSLALSRDGCTTSLIWMESPKLQEIDVDLRMSSEKQACNLRSANVASLLAGATTSSAAGVQKLRLRGWMTPTLDGILGSLSSLRDLTLHTGKSLTPQSLASLSSLPRLEQLSVHASHILADDFTAALHHTSHTFPQLHTLRIRAERSLICAVLESIRGGALRSLYLESEGPEQGSNAWRDTFDLIVSKAANTLIEFTLDQILELDEMENTLSAAGADIQFAIEPLQALKGLRQLRRLTIDAMILPDFTDQDITSIAQWWPHLEHLNLGTLPGMLEHAPEWKPKVTLKALLTLAKCCPDLCVLTIPLDILCCYTQGIGETDPEHARERIQQTSLEKLYVGCAGTADFVIPTFVRNVLQIFPRLQEIDCSTMGKSVSVDVGATLPGSEIPVNRTAGTEDEYAGGQ